MNDRMNRLLNAALTALTAALMAGCAAHVCACAAGFAVPFLPIYLAAAAAAALGQAGCGSRLRGALCAAGIAVLLGSLLLAFRVPISALIAAAKRSQSLDAAALTEHARAALGAGMCAATLLGALFAWALSARAGASFAILIEAAAALCAMTVNPDLPITMALPGIAAGIAAFGSNANARGQGIRPTLAYAALAATCAAMLFVPSERVTWAPMESLAERVRAIVEDYTQFTEQRVAFSIGEKGYDHGVKAENVVVPALGGAASPTDDEVMRVRADTDILLRGTVRRSYTGYSWIDDTPKSRYLYYDFTHRNIRDAAFGVNDVAENDAFRDVNVSVEMLESGASTLYVPTHTRAFSMELRDAVYYNTAGEIFLTRRVRAGDAYELTARVPESDAALIEAARLAENRNDAGVAEAFADYTALPSGIHADVYNLSAALTRNMSCAAEKAIAIREYLAKNYRYTLDGAYPDPSADFVSWFLRESKEGYCSYFASAMAVLCRASGLPARYVEGYYVRAGDTVVTGHNAHAWVEVYLNGLGWTAFDPTARAYETQNGGSGNDASGEGYPFDAPESDGGSSEPTPTPEPDGGSSEPTPTPEPDGGSSEPTPTPEPDGGSSEPTPEPDDPTANPPKPEEEREKRFGWWWILLLIAVAAGTLAVLWIRKRLRESDPRALAEGADAERAALIWYRANLTVLAQYGLVPERGETAEAFAKRAAQSVPNADYEAFATAVARSVYSGKEAAAETAALGERAYAAFIRGLKPIERAKLALRRMLRGIGSIENIP